MRVLLVDDEGSLLLTLAANLELEGFDVVGVGDGAGALELVQERDFDLVLTDVRMPGMSGVELFHKIRALRPEMPVVLMTAYAVQDLVDQALGEGAFAVLPKPFSVEQVTATLIQAARRPVVLVADSDDALPIAQALTDAGVPAIPAPCHDELSISAVRDGRVDVCVVPLVPSSEAAAALLRRLGARDPAPTFIAVASGSIPDFARQMVQLGAFACLRRPVSTPALARLIARARGARGLSTAQTRAVNSI